eukprot:2733439-Rhodomonas_salina.1
MCAAARGNATTNGRGVVGNVRCAGVCNREEHTRTGVCTREEAHGIVPQIDHHRCCRCATLIVPLLLIPATTHPPSIARASLGYHGIDRSKRRECVSREKK